MQMVMMSLLQLPSGCILRSPEGGKKKKSDRWAVSALQSWRKGVQGVCVSRVIMLKKLNK